MEIWECKVSDGITRYFERKIEADIFHRDTAEAGFWVRTQSIPVPQTPKDFVAFMERNFERYRTLIIAARNFDC